MVLSWIYWNPDRFIFTLPVVHRPIAWYGLFFVVGFIIGYFMMINMVMVALRQGQLIAERDIFNWRRLVDQLRSKQLISNTQFTNPDLTHEQKKSIVTILNNLLEDPKNNLSRGTIVDFFPKSLLSLQELAITYTDKLTWFIVIGTILGARLGHVFLYDWPHYKDSPIDILKIWQGGLASHGGITGVFLAILFFWKKYKKTIPEIGFLTLLDYVCIPTVLVGFFIRIGNFFNQEILGTKTLLPWAIVFGDPADGSGIYPRHPVQLYEALSYLLTFFLLLGLWFYRRHVLHPGFIVGLSFFLVFVARFVMEFFKVPMGLIFDESILQTGQILSIPFIFAGIWLMLKKNRPIVEL